MSATNRRALERNVVRKLFLDLTEASCDSRADFEKLINNAIIGVSSLMPDRNDLADAADDLPPEVLADSDPAEELDRAVVEAKVKEMFDNVFPKDKPFCMGTDLTVANILREALNTLDPGWSVTAQSDETKWMAEMNKVHEYAPDVLKGSSLPASPAGKRKAEITSEEKEKSGGDEPARKKVATKKGALEKAPGSPSPAPKKPDTITPKPTPKAPVTPKKGTSDVPALSPLDREAKKSLITRAVELREAKKASAKKSNK